MISYGGIYLPDPASSEAAIAARMPPSEAFGFYRWPSLGDADMDPRNSLDWFLDRGVRVGSFFNPWGASRWGYAHVIVDEPILGQIRTLAYSGPSKYKPLAFVMDDSVGKSMTTNLWMLPAVPLQAIDANFNLYLMTLVDDRFFWYERGTSISITEKTTTWAGLYSQIGTALGVTIIAETVSADYLYPGVGFAKAYDYLPLLLDWVASSVGQRIVRTLDGKIYARSATTAKSLMVSQGVLYKKISGGSLDLGVLDV